VRVRGTAKGELQAARRIAKRAGVAEHRFVSIPELREAGDIQKGPLSGGAVPPTYIPMKNAVFYGLAAAYADETGAGTIVGGHNRDDKGVFSDASDGFFARLEGALQAGSPRLARLRIERPLRLLSKPEVVKLAVKVGAPLGLTWSCHGGGASACGTCAGCLGRKTAFEKAGLLDPLNRKKV
jgi:7-cyano-7-deazaguanine synthase